MIPNSPVLTDEVDFARLTVLEKLSRIEEKLKEQDPMLPMHLSVIHTNLQQYEELAHILTDEQISTLVAGQKKHAGITLVKEIAGTSTRGKRGRATAEDF